MATMEEMNAKMTLYFSKSTGEIKSFCTGIQDMSYFGEDENDYTMIWDFVVLDKDNYVLMNRNMFSINLSNKQLEMKAEFVPQYPVAGQ